MRICRTGRILHVSDLQGVSINRERSEGSMNRDSQIERIAKVTHESNRAWCAVNGDQSQVEWDLAPQWQRDSARGGVVFHLDNPDSSESASHENWLKMKARDGWRYGAIKDAEKKEHPCCVPFDQLPPFQQAKDRLFRAIVHALSRES